MPANFNVTHTTRSFQWIIALLLLWSCANQSPPSGGPKDETPPELVSIYPENGTLNFEGTQIELLFDERVDGRDVQKELIISPNIAIDYRVKSQRNTIILQFDEPLPDSTTFSIDFRESIKDVTEKNPSAPIKLAFSTGPYMDTLSLRGIVRNLRSNQPFADVLVTLYNATDTLKPEENEPLYFTKTDSSGLFSLENIKTGLFQLYALADKDNSLTYNKPDELVGFLPQPLDMRDSLPSVNVGIILYPERAFKLLKSVARRQYAELIFSKPIIDYRIRWTDTTWNDQIIYSLSDKTITFYNLSETADTDSIGLEYTVVDSTLTTLNKRVNIKFNATENPATPIELENSVLPAEPDLVPDSLYTLQVRFNKPMLQFFADSITLVRSGNDTLPLLSPIQPNHDYTTFNLATFPASDTVKLLAKAGAFISVENDTSELIKRQYTLKDGEKFGILKVGIKNAQTPFIVELLNEQYAIEQQVANQDTIHFEYVVPGNKYLRVILDENGNGIWDKGNFQERTPPEKIIFYEGKIQLKENWEIGGYQIFLSEESKKE